MKRRAFFIFLFLIPSLAQAYNPFAWTKIEIPGAVCADGSPYSIFYRQGRSDKFFIEMMGGGVCWSKETCSLSKMRAWIHQIPMKTPEVISDSDKYKDWSAVFFPYCTADVHLGSHQEVYNDKTIHHWGYNNFILSIDYLTQEKIVEWKRLNHFMIWGSSAGAIASLAYAHLFNTILPDNTERTLIADSPGLHFGPHFWDKFSENCFNDIKDQIGQAGLKVKRDSGFLAPAMGPVFKKLKKWDVKILLATKDIAMSSIYGDISPEEQEELILSPEGLPKVAEKYKNVKTWVADSYIHTLLIFGKTSKLMSLKNQSAIDFAQN